MNLDDFKNYLDITWDDPDGDKKLSGLIARGMRYIDGIAGEGQNYADASGAAYALLLEYVRYARSNALEKFQVNYHHELLGLQIREEVRRYGTGQSADV